MKKIILASASKRRSRILDECGIPHEVMVSEFPEVHSTSDKIWDMVVHNAAEKAAVVSVKTSDAVVIGADTLVLHEDSIIGKPAGKNEAENLLRRFSGNLLEVYTGICVIDTVTQKKARGIDKSEIRVKKLSEEEIEKYFFLLAPYDKAGGFSIEGAGAMIFDNIKGSYFNILGLPMAKLSEVFREIGLDILDHIRK